MRRYYTATIRKPGLSKGYMTPMPVNRTPIFKITGKFTAEHFQRVEVSRDMKGVWWFRWTLGQFIGGAIEPRTVAWRPIYLDDGDTLFDGNTLDIPNGYDIEQVGKAILPTDVANPTSPLFMDLFHDREQ